jgi:predicted pyridoxine 5'-phosphate oxidase superfamily flavin-nucleotide-binding protein
MKPYREIAFTPAVEAVQRARGSYATYARLEGRPVPEAFTGDELAFFRLRDSFYVASVNADGWPYIQHRGGPRGFVRVTGPAQIAIADYAGNRQYVTAGNLAGDDRVALFFMDYREHARLKLFARAHTVEAADAPLELLAAVTDPDYAARIERVIVFDVEARSWNCQQHIPTRWDPEDVEELTRPLRERIAELEARLTAAEGASAVR